ncbi:MAG: hypothetical protein F7C35_01580 [Desulfurococcales archaeon]|nr:hypothetical protein [Desulfurococcales archaeon]
MRGGAGAVNRGVNRIAPTVRGVLLDASPGRGRITLTIASDKGLQRATVRASYRLHLTPAKASAHELAQGLQQDWLEAWVEEWLKPPWYHERAEIVVVESPDPRILAEAARGLEGLGVARRVNTYPGPLAEALWRYKLPPGYPVEAGDGSARLLEEPWSGWRPPPPLRVAHVTAWSWHGPATLLETPRYYTVECNGEIWKTEASGEVLDLLRECTPHIVVARPEDRAHLPPFREGRWLWFDPTANLVSPRGLLEWMRVSWLPYTIAHGAPIGKILTAAEARRAYRRRLIIDPQTPRHERFRPLQGLIAHDMAGASRIPRPGLYWGVVQLDFTSLYPSLISLHNISAETVDNPYCNGTNPAPDYASHKVCQSPRGLVAEVLRELVERRAQAKRAGDKEASEALKWILVSGFGYLGYRNSLFGSIAAYETVTALARQALSAAERVAESVGYRLVHSIVDSIFVQKVDPEAPPPERLAQMIHSKVGVPLKVEAEYTWLYIPPTLRGEGAVNKYYGALKDGGVKMKGIMAVRSDTPPIIKGAQTAAIRSLAKARSPTQWPLTLKEACERIDNYKEIIATGRAPPRSLVIEKRLNPEAQRSTPWRRAAGQAPVQPPKVRYIIAPRGKPHPVWRGPPQAYDTSYYLKLLQAAARELPQCPPATLNTSRQETPPNPLPLLL